MGNPRRRPQLLAEKLRLIRVHLNISQVAMAKMLNLTKAGRVSEYETGKREPSSITTLAYARLGKVPMALLADDEVSVDTFRKQIGKFELIKKSTLDQARKRTTTTQGSHRLNGNKVRRRYSK